MKQRPLIVELAGPAGAGKTSLTTALSERNGDIRIGSLPNIRDIKKLPFFLFNVVPLLPVLLAARRGENRRLPTAQQMAFMAIVQGWPEHLRAADPAGGAVIILDQGPVYMLSELLRFCPVHLRKDASKWWGRVCRDWANALSAVICLDASDTILMERVRTRETAHGIKANNDAWATRFLARCREAQDEVLCSITDWNTGVKVIQIDTSEASLAENTQKILSLLSQKNST